MAQAGVLFQDLAVILLAAGATALLFHWLKQPVVLGYLLAGFLVGPFSPGPSFTSEGEVLSFLGELGIVFLLFALGLEFNLRKLRKVGATAIVAGTLEIALMLWLGYSLGRFFGWSPIEAIFLGAVMSISSTTIIVKVLGELGHKDEEWAQVALGILIIEDVLAVLILTGLSSAAASGNFDPALLGDLLVKLGVFLGAALALGLLLAPRVVDRIAVLEIQEVTVVVAVALGFGMALLASLLGFSAGLGAFVAGALMAESRQATKIEHKISPLRDVFTAIFFVTIGAKLDPAVVLAEWPIVLAVTVGVVGGKVLGVSLATFLTGHPPTQALRVGMTLAQIGEFGFVIAALGATLGAASPALLPVAIAVSALTAFLTPHLVRASPRVVQVASRVAPIGLSAFATSYSGWVARLRRSDRRDPEWHTARHGAVAFALSGTVVIALAGVGVTAMASVKSALASLVPLSLNFEAVAWLGISILATPFAYVAFRSAQRLVVALARLAVPERLRACECTPTERLLRRSFGFLFTAVTGAFVLLFASLASDNAVAVLLVVGIGVGVASAFLGRSLQNFHAEVERTLERVAHGDAHAVAPEAKLETLHMIENARSWGAGSREVVLPAVSGAGGRTLRELRLRELTGASVVSVRRGGATSVAMHNPAPDVRFHAGDTVLIMGDEEALVRAAEILLGQDLGVAGGATEIPIAAASALVGLTVADARLSERTGASLLVVRRRGTPLEVRPDLALEAGDVLVVAGTDAQVALVEGDASGSRALTRAEAVS